MSLKITFLNLSTDCRFTGCARSVMDYLNVSVLIKLSLLAALIMS